MATFVPTASLLIQINQLNRHRSGKLSPHVTLPLDYGFPKADTGSQVPLYAQQ